MDELLEKLLLEPAQSCAARRSFAGKSRTGSICAYLVFPSGKSRENTANRQRAAVCWPKMAGESIRKKLFASDGVEGRLSLSRPRDKSSKRRLPDR